MRRPLVPEIPQAICDKLRSQICDLRAQIDALDSIVNLHAPLDILRVLQSERGRVEPEPEPVEPQEPVVFRLPVEAPEKPRKRKQRKPSVRLTDSQKREIHLLILAGLRNKDIAARYGVSSALISAMRHGRVHSEFKPAGV